MQSIYKKKKKAELDLSIDQEKMKTKKIFHDYHDEVDEDHFYQSNNLMTLAAALSKLSSAY